MKELSTMNTEEIQIGQEMIDVCRILNYWFIGYRINFWIDY